MGISDIKIKTIEAVDVMTQYLIIFGPLCGDINQENSYSSKFISTVNQFNYLMKLYFFEVI